MYVYRVQNNKLHKKGEKKGIIEFLYKKNQKIRKTINDIKRIAKKNRGYLLIGGVQKGFKIELNCKDYCGIIKGV